MTDAEQKPAAQFPWLFDPCLDESAEDGYGALSALVEPVTLPFTGGGPPASVTLTSAEMFGSRYLVMLHGTDTDLPVGLFDDRDEAVAFAREVRSNPDAHASMFLNLISADSLRVRPRWLSVSIVEYTGPIPATRTHLFDLD